MTAIMTHEVGNFVEGRFEPVPDRETEPVFDPATGHVIAHTPLSTRSDVSISAPRSGPAAYESGLR